MLEEKVALVTDLGPAFNCISIHGSLGSLDCHLCHESYKWEDYRHDIENGEMLHFLGCCARYEARKLAGKQGLPICQLRLSMVMLG